MGRGDTLSENYQRIWRTVSRIPKGKVASYGLVASCSGLPRRARLVGTALRNAPPGVDIPWHRVINAQGRISLPRSSVAYERQRSLLAKEGILLVGGKVDLQKHGWKRGRKSTSARL